MIKFNPDAKQLRLSVGDLVRYGGDAVLRPSPVLQTRLAAGSREHSDWRQEAALERQRARFLAEVPIDFKTSVRGYHVHLDGRLDGIYIKDDSWVVEEVKSVIRTEDAFNAQALRKAIQDDHAYRDYRLQLEVYLLMVSANPPWGLFEKSTESPEPPKTAIGYLVFRNLAESEKAKREVRIEVQTDPSEVRTQVKKRLEEILVDLTKREERRRDVASRASTLPFPFPDFRQSQEELATSVEEVLTEGENLLFSAPPGIGKTAAVLHTALTFALAKGLQVFWVTAKTTQQRLVTETVNRIVERSGANRPFRALVLRAREKICPNLQEGGRVFCHDQYCRFAKDYSRKLQKSQTLADLLELPVIEPERVWEGGVSIEACPFEMSLELVSEADLVIGDYNYIFDPQSALRRLALPELSRGAVLVIDEAHNLYSRGREYYSPRLEKKAVVSLLRFAERHKATIDGRLLSLSQQILDLYRNVQSHIDENAITSEAFEVELDGDTFRELGRALEEIRARRLVETRGVAVDRADDPLETFSLLFRKVLTTQSLVQEGLAVATLFSRSDNRPRLEWVCLDPSKTLRQKLRPFHSVIAMSATLEPLEFFRDILGFSSDNTRTLSWPSPFPRENRRIFVDPSFRTTLRRRRHDASRVAETVLEIAALRRGNYLVFFSSHAYLQEVLGHVPPWKIGEEILVQPRNLDEAGRDRILSLLRQTDSPHILFAVQGGIFGEGVDTIGDMATGVIVVGPGLPRFSTSEELVRDHFQNLYERGFEYTYLYPAMNRVIQSVGRLIRGPDEVGIAVLLGERFADSRYARLFPEDWYESSPKELVSRDLLEDIREFWEKHPGLHD